MSKRSAFLSAVGVTGAALAFAARASGPQPARAAEPSASPTAGNPPAPAGSGTPKAPPKPSAAAMATALTMRRFDPNLRDEQINTIAQNIDDQTKLGVALDPPKARLKNSDEPVTTFSVERA
ncbi:MAG TPA: hypothetical protein VKG44_05370 [Candidatus Baltobacteraceae bacterium]|nr:hypothetical protein [Candidatus Baltobacteraceae bacterium]